MVWSPQALWADRKAAGSPETTAYVDESSSSPVEEKGIVDNDDTLQPGALTLDEDAAGGLGRHLGLVSTTFLIIGRIIGTGIFSTPSSITAGVGSVGAAMMLWLLGLLLAFSGMCVWLEFGCMFPRSGGEK